MPPAERFVTGLVLAAGGSSRLGRPKQLLPYGSGTLLDQVLDTARVCAFEQLLCVVGGGAEKVLSGVDFSAVEVIENPQFGEGCSSSIAAALSAIDPRSEVMVLMLGDQPEVSASSVAALVDGIGDGAVAACAYTDGRGHPLAFARRVFPELGALHGDKGVWKLLDRHGDEVVDVPVDRPIPRDIDTWEDYEAALDEHGRSPLGR